MRHSKSTIKHFSNRRQDFMTLQLWDQRFYAPCNSFVIMCVCFPHAGYAVVSVDLVKNFLFCFCRYCVYGGQIVFPDKASLKHTSLIPALICGFQSKTRKPIINESTSTKEEWGQRWHIYREQLRNKSI